MTYTLYHGDCLGILPTLPAESVDAVICDPPYPEIDRAYGRMTEGEWMYFMRGVTLEARRVLRATGSAVVILQPNSRKVGSMRLWLWEYMVWAGETWNIVQDVYWWNYTAMPSSGATTHGLLRGSIKPCVWLGAPNCYRDQEAVLWGESESNARVRLTARAGRQHYPSGHSRDEVQITHAAQRRGGVTPFNVLPIPNTNSTSSAGAHGHGAGTPYRLAEWWTKYICPPGGTVLDMCMGSGTMGLAALALGRSFVGIERDQGYYEIAERRIAEAASAPTQLAIEDAA